MGAPPPTATSPYFELPCSTCVTHVGEAIPDLSGRRYPGLSQRTPGRTVSDHRCGHRHHPAHVRLASTDLLIGGDCEMPSVEREQREQVDRGQDARLCRRGSPKPATLSAWLPMVTMPIGLTGLIRREGPCCHRARRSTGPSSRDEHLIEGAEGVADALPNFLSSQTDPLDHPDRDVLDHRRTPRYPAPAMLGDSVNSGSSTESRAVMFDCDRRRTGTCLGERGRHIFPTIDRFAVHSDDLVTRFQPRGRGR